MMKKIFALVFLLVLGKFLYAQNYPLQQSLGSDSTIVISKGALQSRLVPIVITDTTSANAQRLKNYPGAQLYTSNGDFYIRNATATKWLLLSSGSVGSVNIYNSNGTLTGNRTLQGNGKDLLFDNIGDFSVVGNGVTLTQNGASATFSIKGDTSSFVNRVSYEDNYASGFTKHSLVDKNYVDSSISIIPAGGTVTSVGSGYGLTGGPITTTGTLSVDSTSLSAYYLRRKDSLTTTNLLGYVTNTVLADTASAIRGALTGGTVTSVATNNGTGITGGTITSTGTLAIDTTLISTRAWRQKGVDSVSALIGVGYVPYVGATQDLNLGTHGLRTDNVTFSTSPTATDSTARLVWSNYYGTLGLTYGDGVTINQVGQQLDYTPVTNKTASTIRYGQAVMVDPTNIVQGNRLSIIPMNASGTYPSKLFLGLVTGDIASNGNGYVEWFGDMLNVNSNYVNLNSETWAVGDVLYPDPAHNGGLTHTEPIAPNLKLAIAVIKKISGINVDLTVRGNITPDITELNNVNITSPVAGSILAYKASTGAWVDTTIAAAGLAVTSVATNTATGITGGTITTTGTLAIDTLLISTRAWRQKGIDSVASLVNTNINGTTNYVSKFTGTHTLGNSLVYDNGTNVGVGTTSPAAKLDVNGNALINGLTLGRGNYGYLLNSAFGYGALGSNGSGTMVTAVGGEALGANTSGSNNTAVGESALGFNTTGGSNTAVGVSSLQYNVSGSYSTAVGQGSLQNNTASYNTAIGSQSGLSNSTGTYNTAIGADAIAYVNTGSNNTALGYRAGYSPVNVGQYNQTPSNSVYLGYQTRAAGNGNNANEIVIGASADGNGSNTVTLGNASITKTYLKGQLNAAGTPAGAGTKALRIDASGNISYSDTLVDAGGTVTSVATNTGTGITGGTITTTGTLAIDTSLISTRAWRQKGVDSVAALITGGGYITGSGTTNYVPKFTSSSVIGNSLIYDNGTNVGIGTSSPAVKLDVEGSIYIRSNNILGLYNSDNTNNFQIYNGGATGSSNGNLIFLQGGVGERMRITSGGNVGIGTSSPAYKLDVSGTGRFTSSVGIGTAPSQLLTLGGSADVQMSLISSTTTGSDEIYFGDSDGTYRGLLRYANDGDYMSFHTSASERMRITSSGNVGIGTTSPNYTASGRTVLDLNGSSSSLFAMSIGGSAVAYLFHDNTDLKLLNANAGALTFSTSATERMRITSGGDVGIGTTSPIYPLFVYKAGTFAFGSVYTISAFNDNTGAYKGINLGYDSGSQTGVIYAETASAASNMAFWTYNGSAWGERMRITSGGDVGIGTSSPTTYSGYTTLALNNATNGGLIDFMAAGNVLAQIYATTSYLSVGSFTNMPVRFMTNNAERMRITSGGNVGIGTTSITNGTTYGGSGQVNILKVSSNGYPALEINSITDGGGSLQFTHGTNAPNQVRAFIGYNSAAGAVLDFNINNVSNGAMIFGTNNTERMRITSGGNVLVGTTSSIFSSSGRGVLEVNGSSSSIIGVNVGNAVGAYLYSGSSYSELYSTSQLNFAVNGSTRISITTGGNVLIGTSTNAGYKLDLFGQQRIYNAGLTLDFTANTGGIRWDINPYIAGVANGGLQIYDATNSASRLVITQWGEVVVGATSAFSSGLFCSDGGTSFVPFASKVGTTSNSAQMYFNNPNGAVGSITTSGSTTSYNIVSDYRLKEDFKSFNGLALIDSMNVYDYQWKIDSSRAYGVKAHELQAVIPYAVTGEKDGKEMQQVDYSKLVPILIEAVKELNAKVEALEAELKKK